MIASLPVAYPTALRLFDDTLTGGELQLTYETRQQTVRPYDQPRFSHHMTKWKTGWSTPSRVTVDVVDSQLVSLPSRRLQNPYDAHRPVVSC